MAALWNVFSWHEENSHVEKVATWIGLGVVAVVVVGVMFGVVSIETEAQRFVWEAVKLVVAVLVGRIHGREYERIKRSGGDQDTA